MTSFIPLSILSRNINCSTPKPVFQLLKIYLGARRFSESVSVEDSYAKDYLDSIKNPEEYWARHGEKLTWFKKWNSVVDNTNPPFTKWLA